MVRIESVETSSMNSLYFKMIQSITILALLETIDPKNKLFPEMRGLKERATSYRL